MKPINLILFLLALTVTNISSAICLNGKPSLKIELEKSNSVVIATTLNEEKFSSLDDPQGIDHFEYKVRVDEILKGGNFHELKITSENTSSRFPLEVGKKYLLFLRIDGGKYFVDSCGNSHEFKKDKKTREIMGLLKSNSK